VLEDRTFLPVLYKNTLFPELRVGGFLLMVSSSRVSIIPVVMAVTVFYPTGEGSRQLLDAKVKLIANPLCNSRQLYDHTIDDSMICAGNLQKPGSDTCQVRNSTWYLEVEAH
jgi:hypothetical protein